MGFSLPQIETSREPLAGAASLQKAKCLTAWLHVARSVYFCASRLAFAGFLLLTSVYCLLVSVPFSYFGFIRNPLMPWIPVFVRLHGLIYAVLFGTVAITLIPDLRCKKRGKAAVAFLALNAGIAFYLWRGNALANTQPDFTSYLWSMFALLPLVCLAALDLSWKEDWRGRSKERSLDLATTTFAAIAVSVAFAAASLLRGTLQGNDLAASLALRGFAATLCFHLTIFTTIGLILVFIQLMSRRAPWPNLSCFVLTRILVCLLFAQALRTMILPTISFEGTQATIFAAVISLVVVFVESGVTARLQSLGWNQKTSVPRIPAPVLWILGAFVLFAVAYGIPLLLGSTDWDFVLQRMAVIAVWLLALQATRRGGFRVRGKTASVALFLVLACALVGFVHYARQALYNPDPSAPSHEMLDTYAGADISFKTAYDVLSRPVNDKAYRQFYEFLKQNTNLGREVAVGPADVRLVSNLQPVPGIKPNIFIFVIDSLRQDYVSPYNPAVDYTPEIGRFAQDSVVMENAFTRYGGTALSEPAIWVGAMQLHKQYIEPFYPMNNLEKLLRTDGYQSYISVDPIVRMMRPPDASVTELDKNSNWSDLDFVPTLKELEADIDSRSDRKKPIFAYSQPQNVHTLTLERSKIKGGRKAASIFELRRMDAAFGEFIEFLQKRGLYENSIIILTADHGDCYGEFGRFGHSDFLVPQVIRIPLIIHLPPQMREQSVWDVKQPSFTTDITPSLYYLLGHRPILNKELFGRPLFTKTPQEQSEHLCSQYLLVSSYAPVYAILGGNGKSLFIVDAVNSKNYYYDLTTDPEGIRSHVTNQLRTENEALIRRQIELINDLYGWHPTSPRQ